MDWLSALLEALLAWIAARSTTELLWIGLGFFAQTLFMMRFVIQWIASERARRSVVPLLFWYFSIAGGGLLLAYSIWRQDPVYIVGQATGLLIYFRNLYFIRAEKRQATEAEAPATAAPGRP